MSSAAQQFSQWLEITHPDFFDVLYRHAEKKRLSTTLQQARLRGLGDDGFDISSDVSSILADTAPIDITVSATDIPTLTSEDLQPVSLPVAPDESGSLDIASDQSGGFLQSLGSGISTAANNVANFLTSSQGLSDLTKLGTAYFATQQNKTNAQLQAQILQSQINRVASGQSPSPITYASANGQLIPIYSSAPVMRTTTGAIVAPGSMPPALVGAITTGQSQWVTLPDGTTGYVVPPNVTRSLSLSSNVSAQQLLPWVFLIGGGLLLLKALR